MEKPDFITPIIDVIKPYDPIDLLAKVGALQLCSENADHAVRLETLAHAINCQEYEANKPACTRHRLDRICNEQPLGMGPVQMQEDPTPNAFTEAFTFYGGSYIVLPGQVIGATFILKNICAAIFKSSKLRNCEEFKKRVGDFVRSALELSSLIASRAGLERNMEPGPFSRRIFIPPDIDARKNSVVFSSGELGDHLLSVGVSLLDLEPLIQPFGQLKANSFSFENGPLFTQPIVRFEDTLIVVEPGLLLAAIRHQVLLMAREYGHLDLLFDGYRTASLFTIGSSLDRLGSKQIPLEIKKPDIDLELQMGIWTLDTDKVICTIVWFDDFSDYSEEDIFADLDAFDQGDLVDENLAVIEKQIQDQIANLGEIFFLLILAGIGRSRSFGLNLDNLAQPPRALWLTAEELEVLSLLYGSDALFLYKFAGAWLSIRTSAKVMSWSTLDEYAIYRKYDFSYYLSDDAKPSFLNIGAGSEREVRLEVLQELDIHAVPYFKHDGWIEVKNFNRIPSCPIYTPLQRYNNQFSLLLEITPVPIWVNAQYNEERLAASLNIPHAGIFADFIVYWLWQFEGLSDCLAEIEFDSPLVLEIRVDEERNWNSSTPEDEETDEAALSIQVKPDYSIQITFNPPARLLLYSDNNSGEIQIMKKILEEGICELLRSDGWIEQADQLARLVPTFVERQIARPRKKKVFSVNTSNTPSLLPGNPVDFRKVQDADISFLLDNIGVFLQNEMHLQPGIIPKDQHTKMLNSIVSFCFTELCGIINNLSPDHLLDFLITYDEAIISERSLRRITVTTQIECFGTSQEVVEQVAKLLPELDEAALASRFLIELVVSVSPNGNNPISLALYDRLMALASVIIGRGSQSDFARYNLFDFHFELLGSGRLGFNRNEFNDRIQAFQSYRSLAEIETASERFSKWWEIKEEIDPEDFPPQVIELDQAFTAEFGLPLSDISVFLAELANLSIDIKAGQLKTMERNALVGIMNEIIGWEPNRLNAIIDFLSLSPRKEFLSPHAPYTKTDVYPWRMSRGLSYMRRPLLVVHKNNQTLICWGVRHLFRSFEYLLNSSVSGRLQDEYKSIEMRAFHGKVHREDGEYFNERVNSAIAIIDGVIVTKKVKKFGKTRIGAPGNDLGDLDVLAIFPNARRIAVIECKDLEIARNPIEMSRELEELFTGNTHNESTLAKHLKRTEWVKKNLGLVLDTYGVDRRKQWVVEPLFVVSSEMITPHFYKSQIPVYSLSRFIAEYLPNKS